MTELIFAVDCEEALAVAPGLLAAGVNYFKIDPWLMNRPKEYEGALSAIEAAGGSVFLDLKLYQPAATISRIMRDTWGGTSDIRMVSVFADPRMLEAAMEARTNSLQQVLAVSYLTDHCGVSVDVASVVDYCTGFICSPASVVNTRRRIWPSLRIAVCPGVAPPGVSISPAHHKVTYTPRQAMALGADFAVIGEGIYLHDDPVKIATDIMEGFKWGDFDRGLV